MTKKNYYEVLGVERTANETQIKHAFRKLVRKFHPDVNDADDADDIVAELNIAYETLSDPKERAEYDKTLLPFGGFTNSFSNFSKHSSAKNTDNKVKEAFDKATSEAYWDDLNANVQKNWEEIKEKIGENSPFGSGSFNFNDLSKSFKRNIDGFNNESSIKQSYSKQNTPKASRQPTEKFTNFDKFADLFGGSGTYDTSNSNHFSQSNKVGSNDTNSFSQSTKAGRANKGDNQEEDILIDLSSVYSGDVYSIKLNVPITTQNGVITHESKSLKVSIPKGIVTGKKIRLAEKGSASLKGGKNGDLFLKVTIKHDEKIYLDGADVYQTINVAPWEMVLGGSITVDTPAGEFEVSLPQGSQSGQKIKLRKKGIPAKKCGDLYLVLNIVNPSINNTSERVAYENLRDVFKSVEINR